MRLYLILTVLNKCSASCNNINDPYAKLCVPDIVKDTNIKVFNLLSRTNETKAYMTKVHVMMDLFGILWYVNMNVINHMMLENI